MEDSKGRINQDQNNMQIQDDWTAVFKENREGQKMVMLIPKRLLLNTLMI